MRGPKLSDYYTPEREEAALICTTVIKPLPKGFGSLLCGKSGAHKCKTPPPPPKAKKNTRIAFPFFDDEPTMRYYTYGYWTGPIGQSPGEQGFGGIVNTFG